MVKCCFDTGVLSVYFGKNIPDRIKIVNILQGVQASKNELHILSPVFSELFYHLCKIEGKEKARTKILSFKEIYPIQIIQMNDEILIRAGELKCQNRLVLSYNDCFSIAYCLINNISFHTTEKKLYKIPQIISNNPYVIDDYIKFIE